MKNAEVAERLYEIADFLEIQDVEYKPRAYRRAARNIESLSEDVAVEINALPERLDLDWAAVKEHRDAVPFVVSTDAHTAGELDFMHLGGAQARRGWCAAADVLNTRPLEELLSYFEG